MQFRGAHTYARQIDSIKCALIVIDFSQREWEHDKIPSQIPSKMKRLETMCLWDLTTPTLLLLLERIKPKKKRDVMRC